MTGKLQQSPEAQHFPFGVIEPALARTLGYGPDRVKALHARLRYLQRFLGPSAKKGTRIDYSEEDVVKLLIALQVQEHGVDPRLAAKLVRDRWERIAVYVRWVDEPPESHPQRSEGNPVFLTLRLRIGSSPHDKDKISKVGGFQRWDYKRKDAQGLRIERENVALFLDPMNIGEEAELGGLILHNLTALITRLRSYLGSMRPDVKGPVTETTASAETIADQETKQ
jgi:hypothetical protein